MRIKMEMNILSQCARLPGMKSSHCGLNTILGRDETIDFEDFLGCALSAQPTAPPPLPPSLAASTGARGSPFPSLHLQCPRTRSTSSTRVPSWRGSITSRRRRGCWDPPRWAACRRSRLWRRCRAMVSPCARICAEFGSVLGWGATLATRNSAGKPRRLGGEVLTRGPGWIGRRRQLRVQILGDGDCRCYLLWGCPAGPANRCFTWSEERHAAASASLCFTLLCSVPTRCVHGFASATTHHGVWPRAVGTPHTAQSPQHSAVRSV